MLGGLQLGNALAQGHTLLAKASFGTTASQCCAEEHARGSGPREGGARAHCRRCRLPQLIPPALRPRGLQAGAQLRRDHRRAPPRPDRALLDPRAQALLKCLEVNKDLKVAMELTA